MELNDLWDLRLGALRKSDKGISDSEFREYLSDTVRSIMERNNLGTFQEVNNGWCEEVSTTVEERFQPFAYEVLENNCGDPTHASIFDDSRRNDPNIKLFHNTHSFLYYQGRYYDAEALDGVDEIHDLPFFRREQKRVEKSSALWDLTKVKSGDGCAEPNCLAGEIEWTPNSQRDNGFIQINEDFWKAWGYPCKYCTINGYHQKCSECGGPSCFDKSKQVTAALWDLTKIKSLQVPFRTDVPDTIPLHWEDRDDRGKKFMCDDVSHHHWTAADSHEDCDNEQHRDLNGVRYKDGILINTPREGYPFGYNDFFSTAAYIAPTGYGEEVKKEIAGPYVDNLYISLFNDSDTNTKEHMRSWMKEKNVPWIGLLAPNGQSNTLYLLEENLSNQLEKDDFQSLMSSMPPDTRLTVSNQGQVATQHSKDHGEEKSNECSTCLDNLYSLYTDMKRDYDGTE